MIKKDKIKYSNGVKKTDRYFLVGTILIVVFCAVFACDCINSIRYQMIGYDEGYNATVAANVMRYGEYRVSYPSDIVFYNLITTGETVILPTALLFKIFGINTVTASIISLLYGIGCIIAVWVLLSICLKDKTQAAYMIAAIGSVILVVSDHHFVTLCTHLIGETAALFFVLLGLVFLKVFWTKQQTLSIAVSGAMFACSFLTKSSMIFILVSILGLLLIEMIFMRSLSFRHYLEFIGGFFVGFAFLETYKLVQLGGGHEYISWWLNEWHNMLNQSGGIDASYSIFDKIDYLKEIFGLSSPVLCCCITLLPIILYCGRAIATWKHNRNEAIDDSGLCVNIMGGICGASLIVYFVLLGGSGLVYARRHAVNAFLIKLCAVYICLFLLVCAWRMISQKNHLKGIVVAGISCAILMATISVHTVKDNCVSYLSKSSENTYAADLMIEFLDEIAELPDDAVLYCAGWWQEPDITLYLDRDMIDVYNVNANEIQQQNAYFIVGNFIDNICKADIEELLTAHLIRVDTSDADYNKLDDEFDRKDFERFSIYQIDMTPNA